MAKETNIEKKVYDWITDVSDRIGADKVGNILGGAVVGMARTKATLDKNLDTLLAMANIPSRGDYQKMKKKLDSLQGSVMSLSRTVEQLRDDIAGNSNGRRTRSAAKGATTTKSKARKTTKRSTSRSTTAR